MNLEIENMDGSSFNDTFVIFQEIEVYSVPEDKIWNLNAFTLCVYVGQRFIATHYSLSCDFCLIFMVEWQTEG